MIYLQQSFGYEGNPDNSSFPQFQIVFRLPVFSYSANIAGMAAGPVYQRQQTGSFSEKENFLLKNTNYRVDLPATWLLGKDNSQTNFLRFTAQAFHGGELSVAALAFPVDLLLRFGVQEFNYSHPFSALYFIKGLNTDGFTEAPLAESIFLVNKQVYDTVLPAFQQIMNQRANISLLAFLKILVEENDLGSQGPFLPEKVINDRLTAIINRFHQDNIPNFVEFLKKYFFSLFDFPISIEALHEIEIGGHFQVNTADDRPLKKNDLFFYNILADYRITNAAGNTVFHSIHYDWNWNPDVPVNNKIAFLLTHEGRLLSEGLQNIITIKVKGYDGAELWSKDFFTDDPDLQDLVIVVTEYQPAVLTADPATPPAETKRLRGKLVGLTKECPFKDATVLVQAKTDAESPWRVVAATTADGNGNFSMAYPYGNYIAAQALLSLTPNNPVNITIIPNQENETISSDFLYLLVTDPVCEEPDPTKGEDDCDCHAPKKAGRLPSQEDLINSDEYTQDIGGACVNLSTPNRTISEYNYTGIVRTSDPDVANYTLKKKFLTTLQGETVSGFELEGGAEKIKRKPVDLDNPIRWQDTPDDFDYLSFYQSVTVATGHILHYKSEFRADGYSLGNLLYSLPLAPGQKKQIVVFDSSHSLQAAESQNISQGERLAAGIVDERELADQLSGSLGEALQGRSSATTSGISAGLGVAANLGVVSGALGVAGGYANSNSSASQNSSRNTSQFFGEKLRQAIMQNADSYRQLNASVVTTVQEGQHYAATTEVVANHNHCHSLTMMYFEVLRHFAIFQELVQVEECVFVPLIMTNFTMENISKWSDVLAVSLLPVPSNTYLRPFSWIRQHPLLRAFDANERIKTNYAHVDFPAARYCDDAITAVNGNFSIRISLPRPKTKFDRILSLPIIRKTVTTQGGVDVGGTIRDNIKSSAIAAATGGLSLLFGGGPSVKYETVSHDVITPGKIFDLFMTLDENFETVPPAQCIRVHSFQEQVIFVNGSPVTINFFHDMPDDKKLWDAYAAMLGITTMDLFDKFSNNVVADWDRIFYNEVSSQLAKAFVNQSAVVMTPFSGLDITSLNDYTSREQLLRYNFQAKSSFNRAAITEVKLQYFFSAGVSAAHRATLDQNVKLIVESLNINYSTAHYNGRIYNSYVGNDLLDGVTLPTPMNYDEQRNPKKEDVFLVNKLTEHLNSHLEHYNKALWYKLDADRRYMLLDGFNIQVYDEFGLPVAYRSLASVVKNELITVTGNSMVFPVAAGYRVGQSHIIEHNREGKPVDISLFDHYRPLTPAPPFRISVPSRGVFLEAVQGACDACEKVKDNTSQDWTKFTADEPTPISPLTPPVPTITDWKAAFKDFAPPIVNIQNAPTLPAPGAGLAGLGELLGKAGIFNDITGLDANQQNVLKTYLSNQENAKAFAEMAKEMQMQGHNTSNSDKIMDTLKSAKQDGAISQDDYSKLVKEHIRKQIDGGEQDKADAEKEKAAKPSLSDAAVKAVDQGKNVKAQKTDANTGNTESIDISSGPSDQSLAAVSGSVPKLKQDNNMSCWATVATMMVSWKEGKKLSVEEVLQKAGAQYLAKFQNKEGLPSAEKEAFIEALGMEGEPPASYTVQQYIDWLKQYGPLWITTDSSAATGQFSPHARVVTSITGTGSADGSGTNFIFIDPATGTELTEPFDKFLKAYEQMVTDNPGDLFIQIVHFKAAQGGEGGGPVVVPPSPVDLFRAMPADPLTANTKFQNALQAAVNALETTKGLAAGTFPVRFTLADITGGTPPFKAAFFKETVEDYIASEAKVSVMYGAFALRDMVQRFADQTGITTMTELIKQLKLQVNPWIKKAVKKVETATNISDTNRLPNYAACFDSTLVAGKLKIAFKSSYMTSLEDMIIVSDNNQAGASVRGIGYGYLNGALAAANCLDLTNLNGLWMGGDYSKGTIYPYVRIPCVNDGTTAQGGTARSMAALVALLFSKKLLDTAACDEQLDLLHRAVIGNGVTVDTPWLARPPGILTGKFTHNKLGVGPLGTAGPSVFSEISILKDPVAAGRQYIVSWQNLKELNPIDFTDLAKLVKDAITAYEI
ncbi:papain-like cysteine protease family protein [Flavihumibacter profundi]|uniref:papain-like cysteine protease family protein n=1 Tax=Flavihumibacter profundi TaxID=2716883 RepID=UPI001CC54B32|nr:papain-like cysteine protease family protein [Flavihumibacter profundi]MBZ5857543.1 hypothetical protein [Flavihumibacter profundi]